MSASVPQTRLACSLRMDLTACGTARAIPHPGEVMTATYIAIVVASVALAAALGYVLHNVFLGIPIGAGVCIALVAAVSSSSSNSTRT